jgi:hypothetical protein
MDGQDRFHGAEAQADVVHRRDLGDQVLKTFMNVGNISDRDITWHIVMHLVFIGSGLMMAPTDRVSEGGAKRIDKSASPAG